MRTQSTLFPTEIAEDEVLYIIGNGFDKAHDIESGYWDFKGWCIDTGRNIDVFDSLFSTQEDFWGNVEGALGNYDESAILDFCKPDEDFDFDHSLSSSARIEDAPMHILKPALDNLKDYFADWVDSINISDSEPWLRLYKNAKYLSFNYTETLELVYGISSKNILHIHGSRLQKDSLYVFGHNNYREDNGAYSDMYLFEEHAYLSIMEYMNEYTKPIERLIKTNHSFFESVENVKNVYVLGHSLSNIDMPYFEYLMERFKRQPKFIFSAYNEQDNRNINSFIKKAKIEKYKIIDLDDINGEKAE